MNEYRENAQDKDWERISGLLRETDCVPDAPDCRAAVMARIARPKPVLRYRWAYATGFAALVVAAIVIAPFFTSSGERDRIAYSPKIKLSAPALTAKPEAKSFALAPQAREPQDAPRNVRHLKRNKPVMMAMAPPETPDRMGRRLGSSSDAYAKSDRSTAKSLFWNNLDEPVKETSGSLTFGYANRGPVSLSSAESTLARRPGVGDSATSVATANDFPSTDAKDRAALNYPADDRIIADRLASAPTALAAGAGNYSYDVGDESKLTPSIPASVGRTLYAGYGVAGTPVAVAMVTWPSNGDQPKDSYNYAYTDRDTATGKTTECRVKRSGNSVEIYMESKPATTEPPVKGSLEHEAAPSV